jgi:hypothetical protein
VVDVLVVRGGVLLRVGIVRPEVPVDAVELVGVLAELLDFDEPHAASAKHASQDRRWRGQVPSVC